MPKKSITADVPFAVQEWPANKVETWPLDKIHPYEKNPRTHPPAQITLLAQLMKKRGVDQPIVVDEQGIILKGHGRRLAAIEAGFTEFPVVVHRGLSDTDKRALRIEDNQVALLSGWDDELLRLEVDELKLNDYDMPLLGFGQVQLNEILFGPALSDEEATIPREDNLNDAQRGVLNAAWQKLMQDWQIAVDDAAKGKWPPSLSRGALAVHFVRALLYDHNIPRTATLPYTGHRLFIAGDRFPVSDLFAAALKHKDSTKVLESVRRLKCTGRPNFELALASNLGVYQHRLPADFPASLARDLINEFCPAGGAVLDPCHGWGGRLLGFLLSHASHYHGFDVDERTSKGVADLFADMVKLCSTEKTAKFELRPFEDSKLQARTFDFAITSPPYFDVEKYDGANQSFRRYQKYETWVEGFYRPLLTKTAEALKAGGIFALQVGNQRYPLSNTALDIGQGIGLEQEQIRHSGMSNNYMDTPQDEGEVLLILRKQGGKPQVTSNKTIAVKTDAVQVKVSAAMARITFTECGPACIEQNGCNGNCCKSPSKPGGCFVTIHPDEQAAVEKAGGVVRDGMLVPNPGTRGCPFQKPDGLCSLHGTAVKPFGCIVSPFTLNKRGTLIVRNRYTVLPCHLGPGAKQPAYKVFRSSLELIFSKDEVDRISAHLDGGGGDLMATMTRPVFEKLMHNDEVKRVNKKGRPDGPPVYMLA